MQASPWFDTPERLNPPRLRLADIRGSGLADLLYLGSDGVSIFQDEAGNGFSEERRIGSFPSLAEPGSAQVADLRGNGTACLVWTSDLPGDDRRSLRYLDLTGAVKPNLLVGIANNLGSLTAISYATSTRFAVADALAGRPSATRLPFPVHVIERVVTEDEINRCRLTSRYAYHHGYFDGLERLRGFGLVSSGTRAFEALAGSGDEGAANLDPSVNVPPTLTKSWSTPGPLKGSRIERVLSGRTTRAGGRCPATARADPCRRAVPADPPPDELREAVRRARGRASAQRGLRP